MVMNYWKIGFMILAVGVFWETLYIMKQRALMQEGYHIMLDYGDLTANMLRDYNKCKTDLSVARGEYIQYGQFIPNSVR
jgi:hypothetical protein